MFYIITSTMTGTSIRTDATQVSIDFIYHHEGKVVITTLSGVELSMADYSRRYTDLHR